MIRPAVIKTGGELLSVPSARKKILSGLANWKRTGPVVFVHGGGPQIELELRKQKVPIRFVRGRRVTTPEAMVFVERILSGEVNKAVAAELNAMGVPAVGLSGRDGALLTGRPLRGLGRAAAPDKTDVRLLTTLLRDGFVPVLSSVASDAAGKPVNVNADDFASALAVRLRARRLVFLSDTNGVLDAGKNRIPILRSRDAARLIDEGVIAGGMIPKIQSAASALARGVGEVDILNGYEGIRFESGTRILMK